MQKTEQKQKGLSQEGLKLIACITMLIDHFTATLVNSYTRVAVNSELWCLIHNVLRIPGRIAFPIFCFLLVEGAHHTRDARKYGIRLAIGALLSEIPFRLAFSPFWTFGKPLGNLLRGDCSVMVTLLIGFGMIQAMGRVKGFWKAVMVIPFYLLSSWIPMDYGEEGILLLAMLELTYGIQHEKLWRFAGFFVLLFNFNRWNIGYNIMFPVTQCALFAMIPIFCYDGHKRTYSKKVQWAFYLFYPVHILLLFLLNWLLFG